MILYYKGKWEKQEKVMDIGNSSHFREAKILLQS